MTSEVMEVVRPEVMVPLDDGRFGRARKRDPMTRNLALALTALITFSAFTVYCGITEGPIGFIPLVLGHEWGMQMFIDIGISLTIASFWIVPDAKKHGINPWPYLAACLGLGSIAALGYVLHRELRGASSARPATA